MNANAYVHHAFMYVCMCACMSAYMHACVYVCEPCIHVCMHVLCVCMYTCMLECAYHVMCMHVNTYAFMYVLINPLSQMFLKNLTKAMQCGQHMLT